jgi:glucose-6-phosphate isomerase
LGIDLEAVTQKLQDEGVASFAQSFRSLMSSIADKRARLLADGRTFSASLGRYQETVDAALAEIKREQVMKRIWEHDHRVWKPEPAEIVNRLGWLRIAEMMKANLPRLEAFAREACRDGYTHALLLGMGGSSLAPEVFRKTFGVGAGCLDLAVLDSTDPGAVLSFAERLDLAKTLFIVATKSGGTVETLSFFKYFYNWVAGSLGRGEAGANFVAITDPGSKLAELAKKLDFRATFLNDPNIGGRYSALSYFGLVPAALIGLDVRKLLERAMVAICNCDGCNQPTDGDNHGAQLGAIMGELAKAGRDKVTLITSPDMCTFGDWVEQLVAESSGKQGRGILPVVGEPVGVPEMYGDDRLFAYLRLADDHAHDEAVLALERAGHPVMRLELSDPYDLGAQIFLWEIGTVVASYRLGINPFDQPDVESAKVLARKMVAAYQGQGALPHLEPALVADGVRVYAEARADTLEGALADFLAGAGTGAYIALQAYIQPTEEADASLLELRTRLRAVTRLAVTSGYGPRFLHSTGQLHKGDAGRGLFIQLISEPTVDADIPDRAGEPGSSISFGVLKLAQALGDRQALLDAGRKVISFHLGTDVLGGLARLSQALG